LFYIYECLGIVVCVSPISHRGLVSPMLWLDIRGTSGL